MPLLMSLLLLLDASKVFDKISFYTLFNMLLNKNMCPRTVKLLYYMYTNQSCYVTWSNNRYEPLIYLMELSKLVSYRHYFQHIH